MTTVVREVGVPVVPAVTEADVLRRAADLLEEFGWARGCKGMPFDAGHRDTFCIAGAIYRAHRDLAGNYPRSSYWYAAGLLGAACIDDVWRWNDAPGRTKAEVVQRLREAAEAAS